MTEPDFIPDVDFMRRPRELAGSKRRTIAISNMALSLNGLDDRVTDLIDARYGGFIERREGINFSVCHAGRDDFLRYIPRKDTEYRIESRLTGPGLGADLKNHPVRAPMTPAASAQVSALRHVGCAFP